MGIFSDDHGTKKVNLYKELLAEKQEQYEALGDSSSPEIVNIRKQLAEQITNIKIEIETAQEQRERGELDQSQSSGLDIFND